MDKPEKIKIGCCPFCGGNIKRANMKAFSRQSQIYGFNLALDGVDATWGALIYNFSAELELSAEQTAKLTTLGEEYADMRNFIHSGFSIPPVLEDDIDELRDERAAVVKAIQDAGLMRYEVCILPKPENTSSYCAAFYKITATSQNQAFEHGKETFIRGFANCGVTAENFDAEYDIGVTRGEKIE